MKIFRYPYDSVDDLRRSGGFTLIEIMLYGGLAAIIGGVLITSMVSSSGIFFGQNAAVNQGVTINNTITQITELIKQSSSIAANYVDGSTTYTTNASTLVLALPSIDATGSVIANTFDYAVISADGQKPYILRKRFFPNGLSSKTSADTVMVTSLSTILFEYLDNSSNGTSPSVATRVRVSINLSEKAGYDDKVSSASATVNLKNN